MTRTALNQKPLIGANFSSPPKSARQRAVERWFLKKKPQLSTTTVSDKTLPGQYYDQETNLHYNYFRYYDPELGRYITSDPVGLEGGTNTYLYANANSIRFTDPLGLWVKLCARKLGDRDQPAVKPSGNPLRHDYISVSGSILSFQAGDNMYWSQGYIDNNENPSNPKCVTVCDDDKFDKYVFEAAAEIGVPTYCIMPGMPGASNCQSWASDVLSLAKKKYQEGEDCPECSGGGGGGGGSGSSYPRPNYGRSM